MTANATNRERFPELYVDDEKIDRHTCRRVVPMKVLALGMMRTGTASMQAALEILGYGKTYHMMTCMENPRDCDMWNEAFDAKYFGGKPFTKENWDQLLGHCQAVTDAPPACFGPELIAAYPDAKVVLSLRDIDSWYDSVMATVNEATKSPLNLLLGVIDQAFMGRWGPMLGRMIQGTFGGDLEKNGRKAFQVHYDEIRRLVPEENLLEYKLGEGWDRLCKFLGTEIPKQPFPHINETASFHDRLAVMRKRRALFAMKQYPVGLTLVVSVCLAWYLH